MKKTIFLSLVILGLATACTQQKQVQEALFNGIDLSNWEFVLASDSIPASEVFSIQDSVLSIKGEPFGYMYTKEKYENYTLELEWRWPNEATNSGIFLIIEEPKNPFPNGIECQLKAGSAGDFVLLGGSDLKEYKLPEGVTEKPKFPVIEKQQPSSEKPTGEWNTAKIEVKDGTIEVYINGVLQNKGTNPIKTGYIGLQSEGKEIHFRNVFITRSI